MSINRISEVVLSKAQLEAKEIIDEAKEKASGMITQATKQQEIRSRIAKDAILAETIAEASRILAKSAIDARRELSVAKAKVVETIINKIKKALSADSVNDKYFLALILYSLNEIGDGKVTLYVRERDIPVLYKLINENIQLSERVKDIKSYDCLGGVMVEDASGKNRINNTYDARLDRLLPIILPEINNELFK